MTALNAGAPAILWLSLLPRIFQGQLARRVGLLSAAIAVGQAISLLAAPMLTRLFDPQSFGLLGFFVSFASLFSNAAAMRYDLGIVLARSAAMAAALWILSLIVTLVVAVAVLACVAGTGGVLADFLGAPGLNAMLYWAPLHIAVTGLFLAGNQWATRREAFSFIAQYHVTRAAGTALLQIGAGLLALGAKGLVVGFVLGNTFAALLLAWRTISRDGRLLARGVARRRIRAAARRFRDLPQFSAPQEVFASASRPLVFVILGALFGPAVVGYFWLTMRIMQQPGNFIVQSLQQVYLQHLTQLQKRGADITEPLIRSTLLLLVLSGIILVPIVVFGPLLFSFAFGMEWAQAGEYARWMSVWTIGWVANIPAWCSLHTMGLQKQLLASDIAMLVGQCGALFLLGLTGNPLWSIAGYAVVGAALFLARIGYALIHTREISGPKNL